jgi:hypothetical protein
MAIVLALGVLVSLWFLNRPPEVLPTPSPTVTVRPTETPVPPTATATPYPSPETWDLNQEFEDWQIAWVVQDLGKFWSSIMSPDGLPDCNAALELIASGNENARQSIIDRCSKINEQGYFIKELPLHLLEVAKIVNFPEGNYIVVRLDTLTEWPRESRYVVDNGLVEVVMVNRTLYDVAMRFEDGLWRAAAIDILIQGVDWN